MTTARSAIIAAWQPLLAAQHIAVRMILERHVEELARLAVQVVCPTEGERLVPRFGPVGRTARDIQAEIGRLQAELHLLVLGDPRVSVNVGPDLALDDAADLAGMCAQLNASAEQADEAVGRLDAAFEQALRAAQSDSA